MLTQYLKNLTLNSAGKTLHHTTPVGQGLPKRNRVRCNASLWDCYCLDCERLWADSINSSRSPGPRACDSSVYLRTDACRSKGDVVVGPCQQVWGINP